MLGAAKSFSLVDVDRKREEKFMSILQDMRSSEECMELSRV